MTGAWAAGQTFRTALRLVESVINEDQFLGEHTGSPREDLEEQIMKNELWISNFELIRNSWDPGFQFWTSI